MKSVKDGYKMTEVGEIPNEWSIASITELSTFIKSGLSRNLKDEDVGIPCIRSSNIVNGRIDYNDLKYWFLNDDKGANIEDYILSNGDVLVNFINSMAQIGKTCIYKSNGRKAIYTTNIFRVDFNKDKILNEYFYYFSQTDKYKKEIELITKPAVNQASFTTVDFKKIRLVVPTIEEQEKIVSILSTVDEQIDNVDALIEKNKELKKGLMQTLLTKGIGHTKFKKTEIGEIPEEWEVKTFKDISKVSQGLQIAIEERYKEFKDGRLPYITIQYINDKLNSDNEYFIENFSDSVVCKENDILMTRTGNTGIVVTNELGVFHNNFFKVDFRRDLLNKDFLVYFLNTPFMQNLIIRYAGTTTIPDLKHGDFYKLPVVIPSLEEQGKISSILSEIDAKIEGYENKRQNLEELKKGLMQQLLTGNIRIS